MYCSGNALLWHGKIWLCAVLALTSIISLFRLNTKVFVIPVLKSKGKVRRASVVRGIALVSQREGSYCRVQ